jgi:hypothetical protein
MTLYGDTSIHKEIIKIRDSNIDCLRDNDYVRYTKNTAIIVKAIENKFKILEEKIIQLESKNKELESKVKAMESKPEEVNDPIVDKNFSESDLLRLFS